MFLVVALCLVSEAGVPGARGLRAGVEFPATTQTTFSVKELAEYRLTAPVFSRFEKASRFIGDITRHDSAFAESPLFTREVLVLGDAETIASELASRLQDHPRLATALRHASITAREYTKFAVALFAARLAHGFIGAGVLRTVPPGVAADNVAFVDQHQAEIAAVLQELGVEAPATAY
jgi:hypothetical protein